MTMADGRIVAEWYGRRDEQAVVVSWWKKSEYDCGEEEELVSECGQRTREIETSEKREAI